MTQVQSISAGVMMLCLLAATPAFAGVLAGRLAARGEAALAQQNHPAAIDYCEQAIVSDPADVRGFACLARTYGAKEDEALEAKYYRAALALEPNDRALLTATIEAEARSGEIAPARERLATMAELCGQCAEWQRLDGFINAEEAAQKAQALEDALPDDVSPESPSAP